MNERANNVDNIKTFNLRIQKDLWVFLKKKSTEQECAMTEIISKLIRSYKNKCEKHLTGKGTNV